MAPERLSPQDFNITPKEARTKESDIFSLGSTIYEITTRITPFVREAGGISALIRFMHENLPISPGPYAVRRGLSHMLWRFVQLSWSLDLNARPTVDDLFLVLDNSHPTIMNRPVGTTTDNFGEKESAPAWFRHLLDSSPIPIRQAARQATEAEYPGAVSDIWLGVLEGDDKYVAMQVLRTANHTPRLYELLLRRVQETYQLRHPNILHTLGVCPEWRIGRVSVLYDWMMNGNLVKYLEDRTRAVDYSQLLRDIGRGLLFLHSNNIVHGDVTPTNILVNDNGTALLRCFSVESCIEAELDTNLVLSSVGRYVDVRWRSPERLQEDLRTKEGDIYTLGMTIYWVLFDRIPFPERGNIHNLSSRILGGERPVLISDGSEATKRGMTPDLVDFIQRSWNDNAAERPTIQRLLDILGPGTLSGA